MGRKTVAWNQKVSSWGLTTQAWSSSQAEGCLLVRREGRRGSKEGDKEDEEVAKTTYCEPPVKEFTSTLESTAAPYTPQVKGCVLCRKPCCWWLELQGNNQENWASMLFVAAAVVLSKRACEKTQSWSWWFVMPVFNEKTQHCLWLLRLCYDTNPLTMWGRAKVTTFFSNEEKSNRSLQTEILITLQVFASNRDSPDLADELPPKCTTLPFSGKKTLQIPRFK